MVYMRRPESPELLPLKRALKHGTYMSRSPTVATPLSKQDMKENERVVKKRLSSLSKRGGKWTVVAHIMAGALGGLASSMAYIAYTKTKDRTTIADLLKETGLSREEATELVRMAKDWGSTLRQWM